MKLSAVIVMEKIRSFYVIQYVVINLGDVEKAVMIFCIFWEGGGVAFYIKIQLLV